MGTGYKVAVASIVVLVLAVVSYYMFFAGSGDASSRAIDTSHLPAPTPPASAATPSQGDPSLTLPAPGSVAPGSVAPTPAPGTAPGTVAHISDDEVQALLNSTAPAAATGSTTSTTPGAAPAAPRPTGSAPVSGPALTLSATDGSVPAIRPLTGTGTASSAAPGSSTHPSTTFTIPPSTSSSRPSTTLGSTGNTSLGEAAPSGSSKSYSVKQGDTLWIIAQKELGNGARWTVIARANPNVDPNNLSVGQKLIIPAASSSSASANTLPRSASSSTANTAATASRASGGGKTITVAEGDTLWSIAEAQLGDGAKWKLIFNANRGILSAPDDVQAGQKLVIPTR
ncbi:MAG: LysM peptidoglycan-binding domain-containing protein [Phycisphaerales bacterium]